MSRRVRMMREIRLDLENQECLVDELVGLESLSEMTKSDSEQTQENPIEQVETVEEQTVQEVLDEINEDGVVTQDEEAQLRELAKEKGISNWHNKSVKRLQTELAKL
jgi:predicted DNA binding protein